MNDEALNAYLDTRDQEPELTTEIEQGYLDWLERIVDNIATLKFTDLRAHVGHKIECVVYRPGYEYEGDPFNVSIECVDCGEVLLSFDNPTIAPETNKWDNREEVENRIDYDADIEQET